MMPRIKTAQVRLSGPTTHEVRGDALAAAAVGWQLFPGRTSTGIDEPPGFDAALLSIAVLPFENLSGDSDQNYFADVLTEDLTSDLARIAGSFVISRRSAAMYAGQNFDARRVARELN